MPAARSPFEYGELLLSHHCGCCNGLQLKSTTGFVAGALVACFRGTEATNLLNWQTNITINMTCRDGLGGGLPY